MTFKEKRTGRTNTDIPSTSSAPPTCSFQVGQEKGENCGLPHHSWVQFKIEVMGKEVNVKKPVCKMHYDYIREGDGFSVADS
jgi:hypothetical protein